jgi:acyl-CoA thioester hydrolase
MLTHRTDYRVIYGDTDTMGIVYHANYFRWFEMGRTEMFRDLGLPYRVIEQRGILLPVSEVGCKFMHPVQYDDVIVIETMLDPAVRGGVKFDYRIRRSNGTRICAQGFTKHACLDRSGRVVRPPDFIREIIDTHLNQT